MAKGKFDPKTSSAISKYQHGSDIREGKLTPEDKAFGPELPGNSDAQENYGNSLQGSAEQDLQDTNPDLTSYGVQQTMNSAPRIRPIFHEDSPSQNTVIDKVYKNSGSSK